MVNKIVFEKLLMGFLIISMGFLIICLISLGIFFFNLMIMPIIKTGGLIGFVIFIIVMTIIISWWKCAPGISKYKGKGGCRFGHICR
jgi:hypothetical protein